MPTWILPSIVILLCTAIVIIIILASKLKGAHEESDFFRRDLWQLRVFLGNFCPAEVVKKVLAEQAVKIKANCSVQAQMQQGSWAPTAGIDPHDEEARHRAFRTEYDRISSDIAEAKSAFWELRKQALLAAGATNRDENYFGVDRNKSSWKDFLPGSFSPARSEEGLKVQALTNLPESGVSGRPTNPRY